MEKFVLCFLLIALLEVSFSFQSKKSSLLVGRARFRRFSEEPSKDEARKDAPPPQQPQFKAVPFDDSFVRRPVEKVVKKVEKVEEKQVTPPPPQQPQQPQLGSQPIPFDDAFVREDKYIKRPVYEEVKKKVVEKPVSAGRPDTGYDAWMKEDLEEDPVRDVRGLMDAEGGERSDWLDEEVDNSDRSKLDIFILTISKVTKELFVDGDYDSRRKKSARGVFRSIGTLSFGIGCVFTLVFYAFPGFISYRGTTDYSARYSEVYVAPNGLLDDDYKSSGAESVDFDDKEAPLREQTRFLPRPRQAPEFAPYVEEF